MPSHTERNANVTSFSSFSMGHHAVPEVSCPKVLRRFAFLRLFPTRIPPPPPSVVPVGGLVFPAVALLPLTVRGEVFAFTSALLLFTLTISILLVSPPMAFVGFSCRQTEGLRDSAFADDFSLDASVFFLQEFGNISFPYAELRKFDGVCTLSRVVKLRDGSISGHCHIGRIAEVGKLKPNPTKGSHSEAKSPSKIKSVSM